MNYNLNDLTKCSLEKVLLDLNEILDSEQRHYLQNLIKKHLEKQKHSDIDFSKSFVSQKMKELNEWMDKVDEDEYSITQVEVYSNDYSFYDDSEYEYYDEDHIGSHLSEIIVFAQELMDHKLYKEANQLYKWLWNIKIEVNEAYEVDGYYEILDYGTFSFELNDFVNENFLKTDLQRVALCAIYCSYISTDKSNRAKEIYSYFSKRQFEKVHIEDALKIGKDDLCDIDQFWDDWIELLKTKDGDLQARLLKEAILYFKDISTLEKVASSVVDKHPSLYLDVVNQYLENNDLEKAENATKHAMDEMNVDYRIRSKIALIGAKVSSDLNHNEQMMNFCYEAYRSDSNLHNLLRLFSTKELYENYHLAIRKFEPEIDDHYYSNGYPDYYMETKKNIISANSLRDLKTYFTYYKDILDQCINPKGSLGWSSSYIGYGLRFLLVWCYDDSKPTKALLSLLSYLDFSDEIGETVILPHEEEYYKNSNKYHISLYWYYLLEWKKYNTLSIEDKKYIISSLENIIHKRVHSIVGGQFRNHYYEVAALLNVFGDIKEQIGISNAKQKLYYMYKGEFPRHRAFQSEMKQLF